MLNLTEKQVDQLADVLADVALLITASTVVPSILLEFNALQFTLGITISLFFWLYSIKIS